MKRHELQELKNKVYEATGTKTIEEVRQWAKDQDMGKVDLRSPGWWMKILTKATDTEVVTFIAPSQPVQRFVADRLHNVYAVLYYNKEQHLYTVLDMEGKKQFLSDRVVYFLPSHFYT